MRSSPSTIYKLIPKHMPSLEDHKHSTSPRTACRWKACFHPLSPSSTNTTIRNPLRIPYCSTTFNAIKGFCTKPQPANTYLHLAINRSARHKRGRNTRVSSSPLIPIISRSGNSIRNLPFLSTAGDKLLMFLRSSLARISRSSALALSARRKLLLHTQAIAHQRTQLGDPNWKHKAPTESARSAAIREDWSKMLTAGGSYVERAI